MGELKCPACKTALSKPLPERCPVCKLEGLNRMFLTLEDYEDWKKNVLDEHIKKLRNHKIFVCDAQHVLVLMDDGTLFQIEGNKPAKVAENVKSVAAGYNYSLYLDSDGKVHFLGNSGIPFKERFKQGNLVFKEVYARSDIDIFGATDPTGNFYVWGDNHSEQIEVKSEKFLKNCSIGHYYSYQGRGIYIFGNYSIGEEIFEVAPKLLSWLESHKYNIEVVKEFSKMCTMLINMIEIGFLSGYEKISTLKDDLNNLKNNLNKVLYGIKIYNELIRDYSLDCKNLIRDYDHDYEVYRKKYGENNLRASFEKRGLKAREAQVFLVNNYIFEPRKSENVFQQLFGNSLKNNNEVKKFIKICQDEVEIYARLENNNLFCLFRKEMDGKLIKISTAKDIMDCSELSNGFIYLIDYSNKIWRIKVNDILKLSQEVAPEELLQLESEI